LRPRPDYLEFDFVKLGSHLQVALDSVPGLRIIEAWDGAAPYADLKAERDWWSYVQSLSKRYQADTARVTRRLHERGTVTVEIVRGAATYDEKYKSFSPGNILDESMMRHLFENYRAGDGRHLDVSFGPGIEAFKLHWSRGNSHPVRSYRMVTSRWGAARLRAKHLIASLRRR
jgi:hypothetical protein